MSEKMTEEETKNFLANNANNLLMRIGTIDGKGEPNVRNFFVIQSPNMTNYSKLTLQPKLMT